MRKVDRSGKSFIDGHFCEGLSAFHENDQTGYYDENDDVVIEPQWDFGSDFRHGYAWVEKDNKCGYIDTTGKVVIEPQYEYASHFDHDGVAMVMKNRKMFKIDVNGKRIAGV